MLIFIISLYIIVLRLFILINVLFYKRCSVFALHWMETKKIKTTSSYIIKTWSPPSSYYISTSYYSWHVFCYGLMFGDGMRWVKSIIMDPFLKKKKKPYKYLLKISSSKHGLNLHWTSLIHCIIFRDLIELTASMSLKWIHCWEVKPFLLLICFCNYASEM